MSRRDKGGIFALLNCLIIFLSVLVSSSSAFATILQSGVTDVVSEENHPEFVEQCRIRIYDVAGGTIEVSINKGVSWEGVGKVLYPTSMVSNTGYTASRWIEEGEIAAVAVNAIHVKTDYNWADDRGVIFSILPKDQLQVPGYYNSYLSPDSSIYTDISAGQAIFGGEYTPYVGNKVSTQDASGNLYPVQLGFVPKQGDVLVIVVDRPFKYPKEIVFENRFGGLITLEYIDGEKKVIGTVLKPVVGVGRFTGTKYVDLGRIRANHPGVIDVSTSPMGETGGFQIIPAAHGMSDEMVNARLLTQWMVVGPVSATEKSPEGVAPLFKYYLNPRYVPADIMDPDWDAKALERFLVEVKLKGSDAWRPMPSVSVDPDKPLPAWANKSLEDVTYIRVLFPIFPGAER